MSTKCYKTTNNRYFNCPPRMDDGRHFTDYRPTCDVNTYIAINNNVKNSNDYRMFLMDNAEKLININRLYTTQINSCGPCAEPYNQGTMLPEKNMLACDKNVCKNSLNVLTGLGQGRNYGNKTNCGNNWKWPKNVPYSGCAQNVDLFDYYNSTDVMKEASNFPRLTTQSGGLVLEGGDPAPYNMYE